MQLGRSKNYSNEYVTYYFPIEPIHSQTTVTKMEVIKMPSEVKEEVIATKKTSFAFDLFGLFTTTTKTTRNHVVNNDIKKQKCIITPEMEGMADTVRSAIQQMNPDAVVSVSNTVHGRNKDALVEGETITVGAKITEMNHSGEFIINWVLKSNTSSEV